MTRQFATLSVMLLYFIGCSSGPEPRSPVQAPQDQTTCGSHVECYTRALEAIVEAKTSIALERQALKEELVPMKVEIEALKARVNNLESALSQVKQFAQQNGISNMQFRNNDPEADDLRRKGYTCVRLDDPSTPSLTDDHICFRRP